MNIYKYTGCIHSTDINKSFSMQKHPASANIDFPFLVQNVTEQLATNSLTSNQPKQFHV